MNNTETCFIHKIISCPKCAEVRAKRHKQLEKDNKSDGINPLSDIEYEFDASISLAENDEPKIHRSLDKVDKDEDELMKELGKINYIPFLYHITINCRHCDHYDIKHVRVRDVTLEEHGINKPYKGVYKCTKCGNEIILDNEEEIVKHGEDNKPEYEAFGCQYYGCVKPTTPENKRYCDQHIFPEERNPVITGDSDTDELLEDERIAQEDLAVDQILNKKRGK